MKRALLRNGILVASINVDDKEAFWYSSKARVGFGTETLESLHKDGEKSTVDFSLYHDGILQQDLVKEPKNKLS